MALRRRQVCASRCEIRCAASRDGRGILSAESDVRIEALRVMDNLKLRFLESLRGRKAESKEGRAN